MNAANPFIITLLHLLDTVMVIQIVWGNTKTFQNKHSALYLVNKEYLLRFQNFILE